MIVWFRWQFNKFRKWWRERFPKRPVKETFVVPLKADGSLEYDYSFKRTKAYADQRQKEKRNRRRKPSKAMSNLYKLA